MGAEFLEKSFVRYHEAFVIFVSQNPHFICVSKQNASKEKGRATKCLEKNDPLPPQKNN